MAVWDIPLVRKGIFIKNRMAISIDPDEMALERAISSGSMLFANIIQATSRDEGVNLLTSGVRNRFRG